MTRFSPQLVKAKVYDLIAPAPLLLVYGLGVAALFPQITEKGHQLTTAFDPVLALAMLSQVTTVLFMGLQAVLFIVRRFPVRKARGVMPRLAALVASNLPMSLLVLPTVQTTVPVTFASMVLVVGGTMVSIYVAAILGRSFSVLPQARGLVTWGPYRWIRHPLYLAEQIALFGFMLQFAQPWSCLIAVACFAAQLPRMHYEEEVLVTTYPAYRAYMRDTSRLIPGVY
ncbi:MAG: isoprenylcysteine carboxylmethyltransferase family protein [Nitrospirota bacterium]|nr:isoprenylcysteine carboxylmethyltransferase family protein [Nitrospirota bacterium]